MVVCHLEQGKIENHLILHATDTLTHRNDRHVTSSYNIQYIVN